MENWYEKTRAKTEHIFHAIIKHDFVIDLMQANLDKDIFGFYVNQDSLYLSEYKKSLVTVGTKCLRPDETQFFYASATGIIEVEDALHKTFLDTKALTNDKYHDDQRKEKYLLYDASYQYRQKIYNPHPEAKEPKRKATSYHLGRGNVLDYIFISQHFNKKNKNKIAHVTDYVVLDTHLNENKDGSLLNSDHAQVVCELSCLLPC